MDINFFIGPVVGAVIGCITNGIAIKMLFRPLNPIKIGKFTLPFTPGVIPKEKPRLARTIGQVVSRELLDEEVFKASLLKPQMIEAIRSKVYDSIEQLKEDERSLIEVAEEMLGEDKANSLIKDAEENITFTIYSRVINMGIGKLLVDRMVTSLKSGTISQLLGPMSFLIKDQMIDSLGEKIEPVISEMITNESEEIIKKAVEDESVKLRFKTVAEGAEKIDEHKEHIAQTVICMYESFINKQIGNVLEKLDIAGMVEQKIMEFDTLQMEKIILQIMEKELKGLVWLGGLLGGIMGIVMSLF